MEPHYKLVTLGSFGVGKTCILMRATDQEFKIPENYMCTIGVDYKVKMHEFNGKTLKLVIWDTAGQERYYSVNKFYFSGCQGVILVYDITNTESLDKIPMYLDDFKQYAQENCSYVLVGNKKDAKDRKVSYEQGEAMAKANNIPFLECSALTGENIDKIFDLSLLQFTAEEPKLEQKSSFIVNHDRQKKKCCI
jgi:small GTP-binding protein